jgi:hypothetical protein
MWCRVTPQSPIKINILIMIITHTHTHIHTHTHTHVHTDYYFTHTHTHSLVFIAHLSFSNFCIRVQAISIVYAYERKCSYTYTIPTHLAILQVEKREERNATLI